MKNFFSAFLFAFSLLVICSCQQDKLLIRPQGGSVQTVSLGVDDVARIFARLPIETSQMQEVYGAVASSCKEGYDEEYTMQNLICNPGKGLGNSTYTKASLPGKPLRELLEDYLAENLPSVTKAAGAQSWLNALSESDYQIYWPYSENWDGETLPVITYDPLVGADTNWGYIIDRNMNVLDSLLVTEEVAKSRPVWVINRNNDSDGVPLQQFVPYETDPASISTKGMERKLVMKRFTMLRNYDSWFSGGSEFFVKCGSVNGFTASTEAELKLYQPSVTDFMVVVPRSKKGKEVDYDAIIMTNFTNQLENLAFLITEDDGGTQTSWKCSATVKIKSKSYGFDLEIPYNQKDDIVWRGQLSASYFQSEDQVTGRFGDVMITFALE